MAKPRIAVTMGDPAGVGPELCLRLLDDDAITSEITPIVFAHADVLRAVATAIGTRFSVDVIDASRWHDRQRAVRTPTVVDIRGPWPISVTPGAVDAATGGLSFACVEAAIHAALAGEVDAVTTGPIHKEAWSQAGVPFPGHTELFADRTAAASSCMMLTSPEITCSLVTVHLSLAEVPQHLSTEQIFRVIELSHQAMQLICGRKPRLQVCGLNPHAGENGLFGDEEQRFIRPAISAAQSRGMDVAGPLPADTAFLPEQRRKTDCYVCMYHDQGLIPLKTLAFYDAVNVTLGLPIVRTSVDHGTALDIAWQGKADATSLFAAVRLAARLAQVRS